MPLTCITLQTIFKVELIMAESYFIAKVYRQHNSLVITVPLPVTIALGIERGNHVVFTWKQNNGEFEFSKFVPVGDRDGRDKEHSDIGDQGGRA